MTTFRKSVSWSKFNLALECPLRLQKTLEKEYSSKFGATTRPASMGKLVQKVFELYFNNDLNLQDNGKRPEVLVKIMDKVLADKWSKAEGLDESFREEAIPQLTNGFEIFKSMGLLQYRVRSEVSMQVSYQGFRMFGMLDFLVEHDKKYRLFDGKGNSAQNADPNQLYYYGLMIHASNHSLIEGGFIYWKHGYKEIDLSPKALHGFVHGDFARGRKIFDRLKEGVAVLEATPSSKACNWCNWKDTCSESHYKKETTEVLTGIVEIGF